MCNQQSLRSACAYAQSDQSLCLSLEYSMTVKLLSEQHLEFLSLQGGCTGSSESTSCQNATLLEISCRGSLIMLRCKAYSVHCLFPVFTNKKLTLVDQSLCVTRGHFAGLIIHEGLDGGGVWYSLFIKNLAHYSSH